MGELKIVVQFAVAMKILHTLMPLVSVDSTGEAMANQPPESVVY